METVSGGAPPYLSDEYLAEAAAFAALPAELAAAVRAAGAVVRGSPGHAQAVRDAHERMFREDAPERKFAMEAPELGEHAGMLPVLVLLSGLPRARAFWAERGIPPEVVTHTLSDIAIWMRHYRGRTGRWGLREFRWLVHHLRGEIYRLGRVQFMAGGFPGDVHAYRRRETGEVALLSRDGMTYRADGYVDGANRREDPEGRWTAGLATDGGTIRGHRIAEDGRALRPPVALAQADWEEVLKPGDPVLDMHIPAEDPLDPRAVRESCRRGVEFFPRHFPEKPFKAIACWAWLLDPTYGRILPPGANLPRFQALFHLFPVLEYDDSAFGRVFGEKPADFAKAPRDTGLRRALLDLYAGGGSLIGAGGGIVKGSFR